MDEDIPTHEEQLAAVKRIDGLSESLQKEGKLLEALECMQKSLILRGHVFGLDSTEVFQACRSVGEMCNYLAMTYLQQDDFETTLELLKKAEKLTERHKVVRAVTFNNMGCYYRKRGKLRTALSYVKKALDIEARLNTAARTADTHLNMCTILSELKRHDLAIEHARTALKLLLVELFGNNNKSNSNAPAEGAEGEGEGDETEGGQEEQQGSENGDNKEDESGAPKLPPDRVAVLAIAYHNLAVQQEFLKSYNQAVASYEKAYKVVTTHLGEGHPLVKSLSDSYKEAQGKAATETARLDAQAKKNSTRRLAASGGFGGTSRKEQHHLTHSELRLLSTYTEEGDLAKTKPRGRGRPPRPVKNEAAEADDGYSEDATEEAV